MCGPYKAGFSIQGSGIGKWQQGGKRASSASKIFCYGRCKSSNFLCMAIPVMVVTVFATVRIVLTTRLIRVMRLVTLMPSPSFDGSTGSDDDHNGPKPYTQMPKHSVPRFPAASSNYSGPTNRRCCRQRDQDHLSSLPPASRFA